MRRPVKRQTSSSVNRDYLFVIPHVFFIDVAKRVRRREQRAPLPDLDEIRVR
jgi:hypothetical protein